MRNLVLVFLFFSLFVFPLYSADQTALDIAQLIKESNTGFVGEQGKMEMILKLENQEIKRLMVSKSLEVSPHENRTLLVFEIPKDVRGTKLLTWSFESKDDSQWIYLPSLRRVKRITSSGSSSSFMGSEFTFEDLRNSGIKKYEYSNLSQLKKDNDILWKYNRNSLKKSGYSKQIVTVSKKFMNIVKVEYFDRSGEKLKVAEFSNFKKFEVKSKVMWRAGRIVMRNVQTKKSSILIWSERKLGVRINKSVFQKGSLK